MYELHLAPTEMGTQHRPEFSELTCAGWTQLLRAHSPEPQPDVKGYTLTFGPLWDRSYLYLGFEDVLNRTATPDAYITIYGNLKEEILRIIQTTASESHAILSRAPRSVGEETGRRAMFCRSSDDPDFLCLTTNETLHQWMDQHVGRDVLSFTGGRLVVALLWLFGFLFTRND